jgi:hypothetical protein
MMLRWEMESSSPLRWKRAERVIVSGNGRIKEEIKLYNCESRQH